MKVDSTQEAAASCWWKQYLPESTVKLKLAEHLCTCQLGQGFLSFGEGMNFSEHILMESF